jgi:dTDP-4-dehydrorhamnose 3,5-epimerase
MIFSETPLKGAYIITPELIEDERGFFARTFCSREFDKQELISDFVQQNISYNKIRGTLRGMHYRIQPHLETKVVRCTSGSAYDVIIDLRASSPTFKAWCAVEISSENHLSIYVPRGFAHGFLTLTDNTELTYLHSSFHDASAEKGIRFDDPALAITWPFEPQIISNRDIQFLFIDNSFKGIEL